MEEKTEETETKPVETSKPIESDEKAAAETSSESQQVETETVTIDLIDKRLQEMTQTIIDTVSNLINPLKKGVDEVVEKDDEFTDENINDWDNLDL
nr:MAG TPA: hypothetical protein [Caudoviricetes sp.]